MEQPACGHHHGHRKAIDLGVQILAPIFTSLSRSVFIDQWLTSSDKLPNRFSSTRVISCVGIDSYDRMLPLGSLLADALVLPLFDGGNLGVRRRQLHELMQMPDYCWDCGAVGCGGDSGADMSASVVTAEFG